MSEQRKKQYKAKFINQILKVTTKNGRVFQGKLKAIDFRSNLILHQCVAEIPPQQNCPLNYHIESIMDSKLTFTPSPKLSQNEQQMQKERYMQNHYYIGGVMISGTDVSKVEMRHPPLQEKAKESDKKQQQQQKKIEN